MPPGAQRGQHLGVDQVARAGAAGRDDDQEVALGGQRRALGRKRCGSSGLALRAV
jgi:hypothetical protein